MVSDFKCPSCQGAEDILNKIYDKYNKTVCFRFIFCSDYIDETAMACEAAWKQNKNRCMSRFKQDINDNTIIQKLIDNKDYLISNNIYSTPTFIVNGKILDNRNAIEYLEDVIIEELRSNR